jgi:DNA-directed RNA polymerase specialized sigma24 family protein
MKPERQATPGRGHSVASEAEVHAAIEELSGADYAKLMLIARGFARARIRCSVVEPEDLLQEAITKTLDGRRTWNRTVSILKHLDRVMESDAGHIAEKEAAHTPPPAARGPDPREQSAAQDKLDDLLSLFADDDQALEVLHLRGMGFSASEIQQELGISKTHYETVNKRIRRRVAKHLSEGDPDHEAK